MSGILSSAIGALRAGKLQEAEWSCRQVLATQPRNPDALNLLGVIVSSAGHHDTVAELMRQSIVLAPHVVEFRKNLIKALMHAGKLDEAQDMLREALVHHPEVPDLLALNGTVIGQRGELEQGIQLLKRAIKKSPQVASYYFNLAELYRRNHDRQRAIEGLQKTLELAPQHVDALNNLAGLQLAEGRFIDALESIQRLLKINPRSAKAYCNLGILLAAAGDSEAAATAFRNVLRLEPGSTRATFQLANVLIQTGELEEADALIRELRLAADADLVSFKTTHARILERKGDIQSASDILDTIDAEHQFDPDVAIIRAILQEQQGKLEEAVVTLQGALKSNELAALEGIGIYFTLGQLYDSLARYDEAFAAFRLGNENRKKAFIKFDQEEKSTATASEQIAILYEPNRFHRCPTSNLDSDAPIFIIGMPRSGTSLTEQILASHSQVYGAGELSAFQSFVRETYLTKDKPSTALEIVDSDPSGGLHCLVPNGWESVTSEQLTALGLKYLNYVRGVGGDTPRITDKMPYNYFLAALISKVLPRAKIIHCRRNALDTCLSCYFVNFTLGSQYAFDLTELGTFYREYLNIMAFWRDVLHIPMLEVDYEVLVSNPEANVRRMLEYCELDWEPKCLNSHRSERVISTASYQQVRQPIYTKSVGRWKHYAKHLGPLVEALGMDPAELQENTDGLSPNALPAGISR